MRRLYLMRHGQTLYLGRGCPDGSDLTPEGRRQAEAAAGLFSAVPVDLVLASPMRRALGTARIVAAARGLAVEPVADLREIVPRLSADMDLGLVFSQVIDFFSSPAVTWDTPFVGGETFRELHERVMRFLGGLLARPGWSTALAVAHGGVNMALLAGVLGVAEGEIPRIEQDLGCINAIDFDGADRGMLRLVNFSAHDPLKDLQREPSAVQLRRALEGRSQAVLDALGRALADDDDV